MSSFKSNPGIKLKPFVMSGFVGLDTSVDETAQDNAETQPLTIINNGYCDWRGQIVRDPAGKRVIQDGLVTHLRFYDDNEDETNIAYAVSSDHATSLKSDRAHVEDDCYPSHAVVCSTVFNKRTHFTSRNSFMYYYDGSDFKQNESSSMGFLAPAYCCSIQRRLVVAGLLGRGTEVQLSRVDQHNIFGDDEPAEENNVLRGGYIDIGNLLGTADSITGVSGFEQNRLAIFTKNRTFIYQVDPDINNWQLDDRANINIGTISHNTIQQAGTDLIFCSERGVHTILRSRDNGILVYADLLSRNVDTLYRSLLKQVEDKESINAVWDAENQQYHIFFPISDRVSKRLTITMDNSSDGQNRWSSGDYINARCADMLGGRLVFGAYGGCYEIFDSEDAFDVLSSVKMEMLTPIAWHGSMTQNKMSQAFFLHASGKGELDIEILDENMNILDTFLLEIEDDDDGVFPDNSIRRQYERKFEASYRGLRVRIKSTGKGLVRILALGFNVRA